MTARFEVRVESSFEAGHRRGPDGEQTPLHHHVWQVAARARSRGLDHIGIVIDFRILRAALDEVLETLDQRVLEDLDPFADTPPTPPAVAAWIFEQLGEHLGAAGGASKAGGEAGDAGEEAAPWLEAVEVEADPGTRFETRRG
jgi:6-pyruvoyltetrahydropterin/6-carboxytetrahydropterin synthase